MASASPTPSSNRGVDAAAVIKEEAQNDGSSSAGSKQNSVESGTPSVKVRNGAAPASAATVPHPGRRGNKKHSQGGSGHHQRACQTHSFHTDAAEVQHMEKGLLKLLEDFNSGKLRAFGQGCSMEQMQQIRDQQENLARLHFELGARQEAFAPLSEDGLRWASENMDKLMERLEKLSVSIGQLNPAGAAAGTAPMNASTPSPAPIRGPFQEPLGPEEIDR